MSRFERWSIWSTSIATVVTGLGYFWAKYLVQPESAWAVINHPLQPWFLKAHIIVSPLLVFAIGMITLRHVWRHFRAGLPWGRKSGITAALATAPMVITGYLIQSITHEGWLTAMAISHIGFGVVYAIGLVLHQSFVRRWRTGRESRPAGAWPSGRHPEAVRPKPDPVARRSTSDEVVTTH